MSEVAPHSLFGGFSVETAEAEFPRLPITPLLENYAHGPLEESFAMADILGLATVEGSLPRGHRIYVVDFASQILSSEYYDALKALDEAAHREARESEGFLLYYRGDLYANGFNRSFCAWRSAREGHVASQKPAHRAAAAAAESMYRWYQVTRREAWLADNPKGYEFGQEAVQVIGQPDLAVSA